MVRKVKREERTISEKKVWLKMKAPSGESQDGRRGERLRAAWSRARDWSLLMKSSWFIYVVSRIML